MAELAALLARSERPLVIAGGGGWSAEAVADLRQFVEKFDLPIGISFRSQDVFDNGHECYAGDIAIGINPKLAQRVRDADLLLVLGARLGEMTTSGYTLIDIPAPRQKLVHVYPDPEELGRVYQPSLGIVSSMQGAAAALAGLAPAAEKSRREWRESTHRDYLDWSVPTSSPGAVQMAQIVAWLRERLPADAILTNGAGNYATWIHRFYRHRRYRTQLAPTSGSMGYGLPASVAAKLVHPERIVVAFAGDGCLQMTMQEFGTACQHDAKIILVVVNNGMYGTIRMHQEREYPARVEGTQLRNPDFVAWAKAYGAVGWKVERTEEFAPAFEQAVQAATPALIEIRLDPEAITPRTTLAAIRAAAQSKKPG